VNAIRRQLAAAIGVLLFASTPAIAQSQTRPFAAPDLLVVGGTPSGVAAAVTAARRGETVVLVSANGDLGGTLTGAMMDQWDLNLTRTGTSVEHGIFDEMYARLGDVFTPAAAVVTFAQMIAEEPNVEVRYDEMPVATETTLEASGHRIDGVIFRDERTATLETLRAPYVIDATDAGDVAVLAGAKYDVGRQDSGIDERAQAVTEMFVVDGIDWPVFAASYDAVRYGAGGVVGPRAWGYSDVVRSYRPAFGNVVVRDLNLGLLRDGGVTINAIDVCGIDGLDPKALELAREQTEVEAPRSIAFLRRRLPGFEEARVGTYASDVYVRETRHIAGIERLTTQDVWESRIPADSIGLASYPIDLHPIDPTDEPAYAPERHVYGIPFGALVPRGITNLLLARPAISASHLASGSARIVPTTIEEGEADAIAAALAGHRGWNFTSPDDFVGYEGTSHDSKAKL
jgi:ribulose 1,5-bisphosphate synthetase/thiazole synthase